MNQEPAHKFHIPVMGLGFTIDTPLKVARFGISSVVSIAEDVLIEQMRQFHAEKAGVEFVPILSKEEDCKAKRITAYLNQMKKLVDLQVEEMKASTFNPHSDLVKYFELLPETSPVKRLYLTMLAEQDETLKSTLQDELRNCVVAGAIDVNIMAKADRFKFTEDGDALINEYSQALSSFRGFALSDLTSSVVLSAGYNPRLYSYIENFPDFFPDANGQIKKRIILKVSDYRSALTQGKILAKKGIWISEYRIESGLNCGGHAFATDGLLLGPILEEFKNNRTTLAEELLALCNTSLQTKGMPTYQTAPGLKITVQGGVGTANENNFLLDYYHADSIGWGSPFLLVPEATNVDDHTLHQLEEAKPEDYYLSHASPFGIPFNNFRKSSSQEQILERISKGRPGSPCYKKGLASNTEFTKEPICTASREYQFLKLKQLKSLHLSDEKFTEECNKVFEKECLCEGLAAPAILRNHIKPMHNLKAVAICPGPNLAYFTGQFTLKQMADHIYGRINILNNVRRPHMFVNELKLYVDYLKDELNKNIDELTANKTRQLREFQSNLQKGIEYYKNLTNELRNEAQKVVDDMKADLLELEATVKGMTVAVELVH